MTAPLTLAVGIAGNITGILLYASPIPIFVRIWQRRSTEAFSGVIYAFSALSTAQWTYFALLRGPRARPLASLTIIGFALQCVFNCIYLTFASRPQRVLQITLLTAAVCFYGCMVTLTSSLLDHDARTNVVGFICTVNAVFFSASPLLIMKRVIQSRSTEFLPFYLPLFFFLSGVIWCFFAFLTRDLFIAIPNGVNILLGGLQLVIHAVYKIQDCCSGPRSPLLIHEVKPQEGLEKSSSGVSDGADSEKSIISISTSILSESSGTSSDDSPKSTNQQHLNQIAISGL